MFGGRVWLHPIFALAVLLVLTILMVFAQDIKFYAVESFNDLVIRPATCALAIPCIVIYGLIHQAGF